MRLIDRKLGRCNAISNQLEDGRSLDGRTRFASDLRIEVYLRLIETIRAVTPDVQVGLCLEEREVFDELNLQGAIGRCNCVL